MNESRAGRLKEVAIEETKAFLPVFLYIWILLAVFGLHRSLILSQAHIVERQGFAIAKALAFAKVLFLAEKTPLGRIFSDRPLIWPVLAESAIFSVVLLVIDIIEEALIAKFLPSHIGVDRIEFSNPVVLSTLFALMFAALIPFFGLRELGKVFGEAAMYKLFFKDRSESIPGHDAALEPRTGEHTGYVEGQYYLLDGQYYYFAEGRLHLYEAAEADEPRSGA